MSRCIDRASAIILYVFGIIVLFALTYPLARWLGNNDGDGQEVLAIAETVTLSVLISAGLADIVLWRKEGDKSLTNVNISQ